MEAEEMAHWMIMFPYKRVVNSSFMMIIHTALHILRVSKGTEQKELALTNPTSTVLLDV